MKYTVLLFNDKELHIVGESDDINVAETIWWNMLKVMKASDKYLSYTLELKNNDKES